MSEFSRYPHVKKLIEYYSEDMNRAEAAELLESGVKTTEEAEIFSRFIWAMLDQMSTDEENNKRVLGSTDNSSMIPDIDYEVSLFLSNSGFEAVWDKVCDEN